PMPSHRRGTRPPTPAEPIPEWVANTPAPHHPTIPRPRSRGRGDTGRSPLPSGTRPAPPAARLLPQHVLRDGLELHRGRTLVDRPDLGVTVQLSAAVLSRERVAACEADALGGEPLSDRGRIELGHGRLREERLAGVLEPGRVVDEEPCGLEFRPHLGELELDALELGDRLAELFALLDVAERVVKGALREADHLRADGDPALVQRFDRDLVSLSDLAEDVLLGDDAVVHDQLGRRGGADPEFVLLLPDAEPGEIPLDEEGRDSAVALFR